MRILIFALGMLLTLGVRGQNNGQSNENQSMILTYIGQTADGKTIVQVTSKQSCSADYEVFTVGGQNITVHKTIGAGLTDTFQLALPHIASIKIKADAKTGCSQHFDNGIVELDVNLAALPVKWVQQPTARLIDHSTLQVTFEVAEVTNVNTFRVQFSDDGKNWRDAMVIMPENVAANKVYTLNIKLK